MFSEDELYLWEQQQHEMELGRFCSLRTTRPFDPKQARLYKRRKYLRGHRRWNKETPSYKKVVRNRVRTKYRVTDSDDQLHPLQKEYWTRGWESW